MSDVTTERKPFTLAETPAGQLSLKDPNLTAFVGARLFIRDYEELPSISTTPDGKPTTYFLLDAATRDLDGKAVNLTIRCSSTTVKKQLAAARTGNVFKSQGGPGLVAYVWQGKKQPGRQPPLWLSDDQPPEAQAFGKRGD